MGRSLNMAVAGALTMTLALVGCGGSDSPSQSSSQPASASQTTSAATTATQTSSGATSGVSGNAQAPPASTTKENIPQISIRLTSPVFQEGGPIPAQYTCDGADTSPSLRWSAAPHGTAELALFILNLNSAPGEKLPIYWAVAGLHPTLRGISAGRLPHGAIVGRNSLGQNRYTICPSKSEGIQHYVVALFAMHHSVSAAPGFSADALYKTASNASKYKGLAGFTYERR